MKRTNILRIILLLSSLVIGGVVVFLIVYFVTRKPQAIPPPSGQTISDELFSDYLQAEKSYIRMVPYIKVKARRTTCLQLPLVE